MAAKFKRPLPENGQGLIDRYRIAIERNDAARALTIWHRILAASGKDITGGSLNIGMVAIMSATEIALRVDPETGMRLFDLPKRQELWRTIHTEMRPPLPWPNENPRRGRPKSRDPMKEYEKARRSALWGLVHLNSLPRRGADARRAKEGAAHSELQRKRAKRPRKEPSVEQKTIREILQDDPGATLEQVRRDLKRFEVEFKERGLKDRVARERQRLKS